MRNLSKIFSRKSLPAYYKVLPVLILFITITFLPSFSKAQDWIGPTPMDYANMNMNFANTLIMNSVIQKQVNKQNGVNTSVAPKKVNKSSVTNSGVSPSSFAYTATTAQRNASRDAYISGLAKRDSALAASLRMQLSKYSYNTIYGNLLSGTGLTSDNLADALTAYTIMGWMIVNGATADPPVTQIAAVRRQMTNALGGNTSMQDADQRRKAAEELKIKMVLLNAGWQDAQKLKQSAAYASAIDAQFQSQMKLNMRNIKLSEAGLVAK